MKTKKLKTFVFIAMLVALHVILSRFLSINTSFLKIGFAFVPVYIAAYLYGPLPAALVGGLGDFLGAVLFPIGPYFPGFTLSCALTGLIFGFLLHKEQTLPRILAAACLNQFGVSLFLSTLWISILYGSPYAPLLLTRLPQCAILFAVEAAVIFAFSKGRAIYMKKALSQG